MAIKKAIKKVGEAYDDAGRHVYIGASSLALALASGFSSAQAAVATDISSVGTTVGGQMKGIATGGMQFFGLVGLIMLGVSLLKMKNAKQNGEGPGEHMKNAIIGGVLFSLGLIITIINQSIFGQNSDATALGGQINFKPTAGGTGGG